MRITYRQLFKLAVATFTEEQWDSDVTVEDTIDGECFPADLDFAGPKNESLDEGHPVISITFEDCERATDDQLFKKYNKHIKHDADGNSTAPFNSVAKVLEQKAEKLRKVVECLAENKSYSSAVACENMRQCYQRIANLAKREHWVALSLTDDESNTKDKLNAT